MSQESKSSIPKPRVAGTDPANLADLIGLDRSSRGAWNDAELGAVLRHQLSAPVQVDLGQLGRADAGKLAILADARQLLLRSFADLLHHANPPIQLLTMVKEFAKSNLSQPDSSLPREISEVFYYASIVAARCCGHRITSLDESQLREGIQLILSNSWLDDQTRALLKRGLDDMDASASPQ